MNSFFIPAKTPPEHLSMKVPFTDMFSAGEIISAISGSISVYSGTDSTPSNVLIGIVSTDITNTFAIFTLGNGLVGVTYIVSIQATGSASSIAVKNGYLAVIGTDPF